MVSKAKQTIREQVKAIPKGLPKGQHNQLPAALLRRAFNGKL